MHQLVADHLASIGFDEYQSLRDQLLDLLDDRDLGTGFGGATLTLGALCRQMGEVEHAYVESFETFRMARPAARLRRQPNWWLRYGWWR